MYVHMHVQMKYALACHHKKAVHTGEESQHFDKLTVDFMSEKSSD